MIISQILLRKVNPKNLIKTLKNTQNVVINMIFLQQKKDLALSQHGHGRGRFSANNCLAESQRAAHFGRHKLLTSRACGRGNCSAMQASWPSPALGQSTGPPIRCVQSSRLGNMQSGLYRMQNLTRIVIQTRTVVHAR